MSMYLCNDGNAEIEIDAETAEEAAQEYVDGGDWGDGTETVYVDVFVQAKVECDWCSGEGVPCHHSRMNTEGCCEDCGESCSDSAELPCVDKDCPIHGEIVCEDCGGTGSVDGDRERIKVTIEPTAPDCVDGEDHDWESPIEVVGGIEENPGVWGHGGGVIITEVCAYCGSYRETDTWAQDRSTGEQGLRQVSYREADEDSKKWVAGGAQ